MSDKDIIKVNVFVIIGSVLFVLIGILLPFVPVLLPAAEYNELQNKKITIESVEWVHQYKAGYYHCITTSDGEQYNISGDYINADIDKYLCRGKTVDIKYYGNKVFFETIKYAEVIVVDGLCIVHYDNSEENGVWIFSLLSVCSILVGVSAACYVGWQVKHNRKKQRKRDEKIIRKYGSIRKR